jgi:hypothetical protein
MAVLEDRLGVRTALHAGEADGSGLGPCLMADVANDSIEHSESVNSLNERHHRVIRAVISYSGDPGYKFWPGNLAIFTEVLVVSFVPVVKFQDSTWNQATTTSTHILSSLRGIIL